MDQMAEVDVRIQALLGRNRNRCSLDIRPLTAGRVRKCAPYVLFPRL